MAIMSATSIFSSTSIASSFFLAFKNTLEEIAQSSRYQRCYLALEVLVKKCYSYSSLQSSKYYLQTLRDVKRSWRQWMMAFWNLFTVMQQMLSPLSYCLLSISAFRLIMSRMLFVLCFVGEEGQGALLSVQIGLEYFLVIDSNMQYCFVIILLPKMRPSMRYKSNKLAQIVHQKKSYNQHKRSVEKIMSKTSNEFVKRCAQLSELKNRKSQAFNYTQYVRSKDIGFKNSKLFEKIVKNEVRGDSVDLEFGAIEKQIEKRQLDKSVEADDVNPEMSHNSSMPRPFILRNHRQSPVHKSTYLERNRENIRLARHIVKPVITYQTKKLNELHSYNKNMMERIMRYDCREEMPKTTRYANQKIQRDSSLRSINSSRNNSLEWMNPQKRTQKYVFTNYKK